jgi:crotonobetainyl-CoA:carnitine CoA-transferase CaiB-like acyl-CoA transferase
MHAVYGVLAALLHRYRGGGGGLVEVPLCDVAVNLTVEQVLEYDARERLLTRDGNANHEARIQGVYRCDGSPPWLAVSVVTPEQFTGLVSVVGDDGVEGWCRTRPAHECEAALLAAGVPAAVVVDDSAIGQNEQLRARGFFETVEHRVAGTTELPTWPFRFDDGFERWYRTAAPLLGEHNDDVLGGELGLDADELAKLRADGVIGETPML